MKIEIKSKESVYITINGTVYYIDDSTGEQIVEKWDEESNNQKKRIITELLIDIFDRINIDTPSNFNSILKYVYEDVCATADEEDWNDGDVAIAFRRWIENNNQ